MKKFILFDRIAVNIVNPETRKLMELHGGRIWAISGGEGKGSKFTFVVPV